MTGKKQDKINQNQGIMGKALGYATLTAFLLNACAPLNESFQNFGGTIESLIKSPTSTATEEVVIGTPVPTYNIQTPIPTHNMLTPLATTTETPSATRGPSTSTPTATARPATSTPWPTVTPQFSLDENLIWNMEAAYGGLIIRDRGTMIFPDQYWIDTVQKLSNLYNEGITTGHFNEREFNTIAGLLNSITGDAGSRSNIHEIYIIDDQSLIDRLDSYMGTPQDLRAYIPQSMLSDGGVTLTTKYGTDEEQLVTIMDDLPAKVNAVDLTGNLTGTLLPDINQYVIDNNDSENLCYSENLYSCAFGLEGPSILLVDVWGNEFPNRLIVRISDK